jgi:hypothetical protein
MIIIIIIINQSLYTQDKNISVYKYMKYKMQLCYPCLSCLWLKLPKTTWYNTIRLWKKILNQLSTVCITRCRHQCTHAQKRLYWIINYDTSYWIIYYYTLFIKQSFLKYVWHVTTTLHYRNVGNRNKYRESWSRIQIKYKNTSFDMSKNIYLCLQLYPVTIDIFRNWMEKPTVLYSIKDRRICWLFAVGVIIIIVHTSRCFQSA